MSFWQTYRKEILSGRDSTVCLNRTSADRVYKKYEKDDIVTLTIDDIGTNGEGIGRTEGITLFIKDALPGDMVRAKIMKMKKTYGYARLMEILKESTMRTTPPCPEHKRCGGCQIQALSYGSQLKFKENKVRNNLKHIGGFENPKVLPTLGMQEPYRYRNKAQFPVGYDKEGNLVAGFLRPEPTTLFRCRTAFWEKKATEESCPLF